MIINPTEDRTGLTSHKFAEMANDAVAKISGVHGYPHT
jgi:hypothetical protein